MTTDKPASLAEALAILQTRLPAIPKNSRAQYGSYADLADVSKALLPIMGELGLSFSSKPTWVTREDGTREFVLAYKLRHVSGEKDSGQYPLGQNPTNHQALGGAITYGRRYCLCAITGAVADEDEDGQTAPPAASVSGRKARGKPPERAPGNLPRNADGTLRRSEITDQELNAAGAMTDQQLRAHNQLERDVLGTDSKGRSAPAAERARPTSAAAAATASTPAHGLSAAAVPDDDPFLDAAPPLRTPRAAPPKAGVIHAHFKRLGFDDQVPGDRSDRLKAMSAITGRAISSTNDLTAAEGIEVDKFVARCKDRGALIERLAVKAGEDT